MSEQEWRERGLPLDMLGGRVVFVDLEDGPDETEDPPPEAA